VKILPPEEEGGYPTLMAGRLAGSPPASRKEAAVVLGVLGAAAVAIALWPRR
jgi:hypothetical protein